MAQLEVSREQAQGQWPPCCARCGADGDHVRTRRFVFIATLLERYPGSPWLAWIGRNASNLTVAIFSLLLLWSGALFFMQVQAVRPSEANDTLVLLTGLAEEFVQQFIEDQNPADDDAPAASSATPPPPADHAITAQAPPRNEP